MTVDVAVEQRGLQGQAQKADGHAHVGATLGTRTTAPKLGTRTSVPN